MKTGIITGTGKGIGLSTLKLLLKDKYKIISITKTKSKEIEALLKKKNFIKNIYHTLGEDLFSDKKLGRIAHVFIGKTFYRYIIL